MSGWNHFQHLAGNIAYAQSKGVPAPKASVVITGLMLLLGGLGILLGVYIKFAILLLVLFLIGTLVKMHKYWEATDPAARMGDYVNFYKNIGLLGALLMLLAIPEPWVLALF